MSYLQVSNAGTCDIRNFYLLGVTQSRGDANKIGQFGSGIKFGACALLRNEIPIIIYSGLLRAEYTYKNILIDGRKFRQVVVKLSGKTPDGQQINKTQETSLTLEHGVFDWKEAAMGLREIVANALDGSISSTGNTSCAEISIVDEPRAKSGQTRVFVPYNPKVQAFYQQLGQLFLHFNEVHSEHIHIIQKEDCNTPARIYYKGVFIRELGRKSIYDYNVQDLDLDESRNSDEYSCRRAISCTLTKNITCLSKVIKALMNDENYQYAESNIQSYVWAFNSETKAALKEAFELTYGNNTVLTDSAVIATYIAKKGHLVETCLNHSLFDALKSAGVKTPGDVLNRIEMKGYEHKPPTEPHVQLLDKIWNMFVYLGMVKKKDKPAIKLFTANMDGGGIKLGEYFDDTIYINDSLGGEQLTTTIIEEVVHHITGSSDMSRDLQDFAFSVIAKLIS